MFPSPTSIPSRACLCRRSVHRPREAALSKSMELYRNAPPAAVGVPTKLLPQHPKATGPSAYPYCAAAQELGLLVLESCPQKKLECIGEGQSLRGGKGDHQTAQDPVPKGGLGLCALSLGCRFSSCQLGVSHGT